MDDVRIGLVLGPVLAGVLERLPQLAHLVVEVAPCALPGAPVEAHRRGPALHLARMQQRRQHRRNVVEDAGAALLVALDLLPVPAHLSGRVRLGLPEHVRVAADQLGRDAPRDLRPVAVTLLLQQESQERGLEQQVAQLVQELGGIVLLRRLGHLVGLLERVGDDRPGRLLPVPRAVPPQAGSQPHQRDHRVGCHQRL